MLRLILAFCKTCDGYLLKDKNHFQFEENSFIYLIVESRDSHISIFLGGYLQTYNPNNGQGKYKLVLFEITYPGNNPYFSFPDGDNNFITISDLNTSFNFVVDTSFLINGYRSTVYINGNWKYANPKSI